MGKYLFNVLLAVVFWACVIWFGLPLLKNHEPEAYNHLKRFFLPNAKIEKMVAHVVTKAEQTFKAMMPSKMFANARSADSERNNAVSDTQKNRKSSALTAAEKQGAVKDDPLSALNKDPGYMWGIVVTNAFVYDTEMKRIGIFSGGTVISRKNSELKMHGYVSECFYLKERKWEPETVFLYDADLVMFDHTYEETDVEQRNLLIKYCQVRAQYEEKRAEAYKKAIRKNPHFEAYKKAINDYNAFFKKANAAKAELSQSVGPERSKLMDELRRNRADEPVVVKHYKETKERYDVWKAEHIGSGEHLKMSKTVDIQNLETALEAMRPRVQMIVPGL